MGVSGSGKSTVGRAVAEDLGWSFYDADDHHPPRNIAKMSSGEALTDEDRAPWLAALREVIDTSLDRDESLVLACSALKARFRDQLLEGNDAMLVYLAGDRDVIESRIAARSDHYMSADMLDSQFAALEEPEVAFVVDVAQEVGKIVGAIVAEARSEAAGGRPAD
jgi:gluconokinase